MLIVHLNSAQSAQFTVLARYGYLKQLALELVNYLKNHLKNAFLCSKSPANCKIQTQIKQENVCLDQKCVSSFMSMNYISWWEKKRGPRWLRNQYLLVKAETSKMSYVKISFTYSNTNINTS